MLRKKIYIASDHAGYELKTKLCAFFESENLSYDDLGVHTNECCDYADYAHKLASKIDNDSFGVLICGSGIGVSIAANRHSGIRCALCSEALSAKLARKHNDANVIALGGRLIGADLAVDIVNEFINTNFDGGRHLQRISKIEVDECLQIG